MFAIITADNKISTAAEVWKFEKYYGNRYFPKFILAIVSIMFSFKSPCLILFSLIRLLIQEVFKFLKNKSSIYASIIFTS